MEKALFILITRAYSEQIEKKLKSLVNAGIDAVVMCDHKPEKKSKRILHYDDSEMKGWTHHMSQNINQITAWDNATYYAFLSKRDHVWICEDDVFWNKPSIIKHITEKKSNADLIAYPLLSNYEQNPNWWHWPKAEMITKNKKYWTATYNQLCRLSKRLLNKMNELSKQRNRLFFHEVMFATLCNINNYKIEYLEDSSIFIKFRWKPEWTEKELEDHKYVLVHPIKTEFNHRPK